jgi:competence protein ComGC
LKRGRQAGFGLIESIFIVVIAVAVVFAIYHFGWASREPAGETALSTHLDMVQKATDLYMFDSNGRYPTIDGKLPLEEGQTKLLFWSASFNYGGQELSFYPDYLKMKPKYWDHGMWRIDSKGIVSVDVNPKDY